MTQALAYGSSYGDVPSFAHGGPSGGSLATDPTSDGGSSKRGKRLLAAVRGEAEGARPVDRWLERLLKQVMDNEGRVQAMRFVDVLPALDDAAPETRHRSGSPGVCPPPRAPPSPVARSAYTPAVAAHRPTIPSCPKAARTRSAGPPMDRTPARSARGRSTPARDWPKHATCTCSAGSPRPSTT